ncbi:MAG: YkgJ family cysteine cluster protein [Roseimicrobium sp.]
MSPSSHPERVFLCQRCGNCCRWPGDVIVTDEEVRAIAEHLGLAEEAFIESHTRLSANRRHLSLIEKQDGSCVFLEGQNHCHIQPVKPLQCRGFPNQWRFEGWREVCEAIEVPQTVSVSGECA